MKRVTSIVLIALLALALVGCQTTETPTTETTAIQEQAVDTLAVVNGHNITLEEFNKTHAIIELNYIKNYGEDALSQEYNGRPISELIKLEVMESMITDVLKEAYVMSMGTSISEAELDEEFATYKEKELDVNPELQAFFEANGIDDDFIKDKIKEALYDNKFYSLMEEAASEELGMNDGSFDDKRVEHTARHILVRSQEEGEALLARMNAGETFDALFEEALASMQAETANNEQVTTRAEYLDRFLLGDMVVEFENAVLDLEVGGVSGLVETQFGVHIVKLDSAKSINDLVADGEAEDVVASIRTRLMDAYVYKLSNQKLEELISQSTIVRNTDLLEQK